MAFDVECSTFSLPGSCTLLDLMEQFAPPEMGPPMLLKLLEAIERKGEYLLPYFQGKAIIIAVFYMSELHV